MFRPFTADASQGPDEVHIQQIGKQELKRVEELQRKDKEVKAKSKKLMESNGKARAKL